MATSTMLSPASPATAVTAFRVGFDADPSWRDLYRVGAISAALFVAMIIVPLVLLIAAPSPPLSDGAVVLQYIASNKVVYLLDLVCFVGLSLPAMVVFLALYAALKGLNKSYAAVGALIGIASEITALAYGSSPPSLNGALVTLSDKYAAAAGDAQRAALASGAEGVIAVSNTVNMCGVITALSILVVSLVMLKGLFPKGVAYLGIATGMLGMFSEALRDVIGGVYAIYGLLLPIWFIAIGWKLYRLGFSRPNPEVLEESAASAAP